MLRTTFVISLGLVATACFADTDERMGLPNSSGKGDAVAIRLRLTDSNPVVRFTLDCDQMHGCEGHVGVGLVSPDPCAFFPMEARCGIGPTQPLARELATATIVSTTEGTRRLPLRLETGDGDDWVTELAAGFSGREDEALDVTLEKLAGVPDLLVEVRAEWHASEDPGGDVAELRTFLASVPGLTTTEIGTSSQGYRAFLLQYEQPVDHRNPAAGTLKQSVVLHHRDKAASMVLYTSGYQLFSQDYLSELGHALQANQLSTEQRFFGSSRPADMTPASWQYVTIEQAANDHHRIVEALAPFYTGTWLSTGHSKGGMTSIFHRRFFPTDVDSTVAYVAPVSYADPDPRYVPFLDQIGEAPCRNAIRAVQHRAFEDFDLLLPMAAADAQGETFVRAGGHASAFEKSLLLLEWLFWQHRTADECAPFMTAPEGAQELYYLVSSFVGSGYADSWVEDWGQTYDYQAATQLGRQQFATGHLQGLLRYESIKLNYAPAGTMPVHDPAPMIDVQNWVKSSGSKLLFVYGQYDPWSGGAYEIGTQADVVKLVAPKAPHSAMLTSLTPADREIAVAKIEQWMGTRPNLVVTPRPAMPRPF